MKTYNLYCDESCHLENDRQSHMLLGYISVPYNQVRKVNEIIKEIRKKHTFIHESKWKNVSKSKLDFYTEMVDYFFKSPMTFRAIIVKKDKLNTAFTPDYHTFYYKMYYQLLHHKMDMFSNYYIYLDKRDTLSGDKLKKLGDILNIKFGVVKNIQFIQSYESNFLQLADVLIGALSYNIRGLNKMDAKNQIIKQIESLAKVPLNKPTSLGTNKFNLFFFDLK